jgi:hypothetical protein
MMVNGQEISITYPNSQTTWTKTYTGNVQWTYRELFPDGIHSLAQSFQAFSPIFHVLTS